MYVLCSRGLFVEWCLNSPCSCLCCSGRNWKRTVARKACHYQHQSAVPLVPLLPLLLLLRSQSLSSHLLLLLLLLRLWLQLTARQRKAQVVVSNHSQRQTTHLQYRCDHQVLTSTVRALTQRQKRKRDSSSPGAAEEGLAKRVDSKPAAAAADDYYEPPSI
jgi:hypothetical protein